MDATIFKLVPIVSLIAACLSGCGTFYYNEGTTRPAVAVPKSDSSAPVFSGMFISPKEQSAAPDKDRIITKGDAYSVRLLSAYICDFHEAGFWDLGRSNSDATPCTGGDGGQSVGTRGEILIVANAGERTSGSGLSFNSADLKKTGRVIYYNEDVRETGQLLNALNIPVYGPQTYKGGPVFMDWSILELDNAEQSTAREVLKSLASIGGAAYPSASPILAVLNNVGSVVLNAGSDDVDMRYQMEFDPQYPISAKTKHSVVYRAPLQEGYFVMLRREKRDDWVSTDNLTVCWNEGVLCETSTGKPPKPYRGSTWILLRIAREDKELADKFDKANDVADLLTALTSNGKTFDLNALQSAVTELQKAYAK